MVFRPLLLATLAIAVSACSGRYFTAADAPPAVDRYALAELPQPEHWTGIVFNGARIGFAHTRVSARSDGDFEIRSEASLLLRFLGFEKQIRLRTTDVVGPDLALKRFEASHHIDGSDLEVKGEFVAGVLVVHITNANASMVRSYPVADAVLPASALLLYPATRGLEVGRHYRFHVFTTETQRISEVEQRIAGYEKSPLFDGEAYKIITRLQGQETTSWVDRQARPLFELALNGVMIAALEDEAAAKRHLAAASLNKQDIMLDFSLVRPNRAIASPRRVARLEILLAGVDSDPVSGPGQECEADSNGWRCLLQAGHPESAADDTRPYMVSSLTVPYGHPQIQATARQIGDASMPVRDRIRHILDWLDVNIRKHPTDSFSALDVLRTRRAECQGHAYLYAALARALDIPTRIVNGLVYSGEHEGFLYHSWAESLIDGNWLAVDPTFGQAVADATHIKLLEGEELADLVALTGWVGRVSVSVLGYEYGL
ncbi:MAG: transglutaminase-like domain-containing protein [Burkholderiales bacterium]